MAPDALWVLCELASVQRDESGNADRAVVATRTHPQPTHTYPDVPGVFPLRYPHHPEELIDVIARVAYHTAEDNQHVIHVQGPHDLVGRTLIGRHGFADLDKTGGVVKLCFIQFM